MIRPAWGANRRPYWRYFSSSRLDVLSAAIALRTRRVARFTEDEYRATGQIDYADAIRSWAGETGLSQKRTAIVNALMSRRAAGQPLVGVHVRRGDFAAASSTESSHRTWNVALPLEW